MRYNELPTQDKIKVALILSVLWILATGIGCGIGLWLFS